MKHKTIYSKRLPDGDYLHFDNLYEYEMFAGGPGIGEIFREYFKIMGIFMLILVIAAGLLALIDCFV